MKVAIPARACRSPLIEQRLYAQSDYEATRAAFIARQPIGRIGKAEEIATLGVCLASDESAYLHRESLALAQIGGDFAIHARNQRRGRFERSECP